MRLHGNMTPDEAKGGGGGENNSAPEGNSSGGGGGAVAANRGGGGNPEDDFSEFLWMEHEEEFDEQVLRELEDEEILNFYYNLTEAENEAEALAAQNPPPPSNSQSQLTNTNNTDASVSDVTAELSQLGFASRLNPNAQEFVPGMRQPNCQTNSVPVSESKSS